MRRPLLIAVAVATFGYPPHAASGQELSASGSAHNPSYPKLGRVQSGPVVPRIAAGQDGRWSTEFQIFGLEIFEVDFTMGFFDDRGTPMPVSVSDSAGFSLGEVTQLAGSVEPGSIVTFTANREQSEIFGSTLRSGSAVVEPSVATADLGITAIITFYEDGVPQFRTSALGLQRLQKHIRLPFTNSRGFCSGVGLRSDADQDLALIAMDRDGSEICREPLSLQQGDHVAFLVNLSIPCTDGRDGILDIIADAAGLTAIGLSFDPNNRMWTQVPYSVDPGYVRNRANPAKCIHKAREDFDNGNPLHLWDCDATGPMIEGNKTWMYEPATGYIRNKVNPDTCIHRARDDFVNGNPVHLWDCNDPAPVAQIDRTWIYEPRTGYVRNATKSRQVHSEAAGRL